VDGDVTFSPGPPVVIDGALVLGEDGFHPGTVAIAGDIISHVAWTPEDRARLRDGAEIVDGTKYWLIPGLIDAHAHGYSSLLRGTENSFPLELWALYTTLYGRAYDARAIWAAILLGAAERIRAGVTGTIDHTPYTHLGEAAILAHEQSGLRVGYAAFLHDISDYALLDLSLPENLAALVGGVPALDPDAYAGRFAELVQAARAGSGRVVVQLGPNAPQRCGDTAWRLWRELRDRHDVRVHVHLLETRAQARVGRMRGAEGMIAEMARTDMLAPGLSAAHGIWLSESEQDIMARHRAVIVHNPASNLMLGSGVMDFLSLRARGVKMALGTDSANTGGRFDLFETMRLAMMLPRIATRAHETWPQPREILDMATVTAARVLGLEGRAGRIAPGMLADVVLVRRDQAATLAMAPTEAAFVQHASPAAVDSVMVGGAWVMRAGKILAFDEAAALGEAEAVMGSIREKVADGLAVLDDSMPDLARRLAALEAAAPA
jgi:5-methylthioadenosine/S-adenosylhomocysteine deaminase